VSAPNVLLIVWDTCRRDALEPFGAPAGASPVAADLARRGVVAPEAHAASGWTMPSHTALLAGVLPREVGLTQAPGETVASCHDAIAAMEDRLLASVLRRVGYVTKGSSANIWISPEGGFDTGFDFFELVPHNRQGGLHIKGTRARVEWALHAVRARGDDGASQQRERVLGWIDQFDDRPFFGFVNLNECHSPYLPPRPFNSCGPLARARAADEARRYLNLVAIWRACAGGELPPEAALERMRRLYADSVRQMDAWLGNVLEALDAAGRLDDTLVVLTSDHGENFGEGNYMAHAFSLDERLTHVPLVAAGPGAERLADLRTLADLPRRLAELAGVAGHPYSEHSTAVSQSDPPGRPEDPRLLGLVDEWPEVSREQIVERLATSLTAAVDGSYKLVLRGEAEEFHDLTADPLELSPVPADALAPDVRDRLRAAVASAARGAGEVAAAPATPADDSADIEERMRLLGYL
jgi:arylsulfatase A-like enzyme